MGSRDPMPSGHVTEVVRGFVDQLLLITEVAVSVAAMVLPTTLSSSLRVHEDHLKRYGHTHNLKTEVGGENRIEIGVFINFPPSDWPPSPPGGAHTVPQRSLEKPY